MFLDEELYQIASSIKNEAIIARKNKEAEAKQELITFNEAIASHNEQKDLLQYKLDKLQ